MLKFKCYCCFKQYFSSYIQDLQVIYSKESLVHKVIKTVHKQKKKKNNDGKNPINVCLALNQLGR